MAVSFAAAALVLALAAASTLSSYREVAASSEARKQSTLLIVNAATLRDHLIDAERAERGYALTGEERFLEPYLKARALIGPELTELRSLAASRPSVKHLEAM